MSCPRLALSAEAGSAEATRQSVIAARETLAAAATAEVTAVPVSDITPIFGPEDGSLMHNSDDFLESAYASVNVSNFVVQATVGNPFAATSGPWDIGLLFRQVEPDQEFRLVVSSDGSWNLNNRQGSEDSFISEGQITSGFNTEENGVNKITLLAQDNRGYFFLNDEFVALLDLSGRVNLGDIGLGTGFYVGNEREGAATTYQGYSVWPLAPEFGPRSGELPHLDDGLIESHSANVEQVNVMADALFYNPYSAEEGTWDVGFAFRETEIEDQFWLIVESSSEWSLIDRRHGDDVFLDDGLVEGWDAASGGSNRLTLIALGDHGYFFANNTFVAPLDLSNRQDIGDVEIATGFYVGDEIDGQVTRYEEFAVWPLP
jgi:hypothetical protein